MVTSNTYESRRGEVETYFDKVAAANWSALTSDAPVSGIRATVRAGRDRMRAMLLDWLPADLSGQRILDAGCGTGQFAIEAARRGASIVAVDLSPSLIGVARERAERAAPAGAIEFVAGDLLDPAFGTFDHVVSMDALIHYAPDVAAGMLAQLGARTGSRMVFTFVPRTPALSVMFAVGRCLPRATNDRAPSVSLVSPAALQRIVAAEPGLEGWDVGRSERVSSGFYISQALELVRR